MGGRPMAFHGPRAPKIWYRGRRSTNHVCPASQALREEEGAGKTRGGRGRGGWRGLRLRCGGRRRVCRGWRLRGIWPCGRKCGGGRRFPCWRGRRPAFAGLRARGGGEARGGRARGGAPGGGAGKARGIIGG